MEKTNAMTTNAITKRFWQFAKKSITDIELAEKIAKQGESRNDLSYANEWYSVSERMQQELMKTYEIIFGSFAGYEIIADLAKSKKF